jgi:hypothetical protein
MRSEQPQFHAENPEDQVDVGRYLRFVISFLLIMFTVLGLYEYYYGAQAKKAQELQQSFENTNQAAVPAAATSTAGE